MTKKRIAINGFGRIGRLTLRILMNYENIEVVAINDLGDVKMLGHLLKYDSAQKRFDKEVIIKESSLVIDGHEIKIVSEKDPKNLPWKELNIDVVVESTGLFVTKKSAAAHIVAGAKKVVISAPAGDDLKTVVFNVNHHKIVASDTIISAASCTTNCLAPMAQVLDEKFGIKTGVMTTIHAYTNDQNILDGPHRKGDFRRARAAAVNIIPNTTGAAKAIGLVLPSLKGKLDGAAQRVPVVTGSITELIVLLNKKVTVADINEAMKNAANESFGYTEDLIVSSDVIGISYGSLFDGTQTKVMTLGDDQLIQVFAWYDNEMSYVNQLCRTINHIANLME
ncbi:type I glyceraldehyde-3-phosphate dehydrogenase [Spiroplasma endosymbiont of Agriotes lineatus]|uniref:type I glyceraldehyde-3-phosphate dehydrogenase n=1 Tax=Spiroplasma endosymbiont of Agriotes lineatus TaxID=3077930 RepID=UPI0030D3F9D6